LLNWKSEKTGVPAAAVRPGHTLQKWFGHAAVSSELRAWGNVFFHVRRSQAPPDPAGDARYPLRWMRIKEEFTRAWLAAGGNEADQSASRSAHRLRGIWQKRYWEHTVRDESDLERCVDYAHWNPKKHKLVSRVRDWKWSSFHRLVRQGQYDLNWGAADPTPGWNEPEWGEVEGIA
jgi:hypothetical protein